MAHLVLIHNEHDKLSREIKAALEGAYPPESLLAVDFMEARAVWRFRTTPTVWIFPDGAPLDPDSYLAVELEEPANLQAVQDAVARGRVISLSAPKTALAVNEQVQITATATDLQGAAASLPPIKYEVNTATAGIADDGILLFSAAEPGTYIIETVNDDALNASLEVVVS